RHVTGAGKPRAVKAHPLQRVGFPHHFFSNSCGTAFMTSSIALSLSSPARKAKLATTFCLVNKITVTSASLFSLYDGGPSASSNAPTGTFLSPFFCAHFARASRSAVAVSCVIHTL